MTTYSTLQVIGDRVKNMRLKMNISQAECAKRSGISRKTVQTIEKGESISLAHFIAILSTLGLLADINLIVPEFLHSPLQLAKNRGVDRQRASKNSSGLSDEEHVQW